MTPKPSNLICNPRRTPRDLAYYIKATRGYVEIIQDKICNPSLVCTSLGLPSNRIFPNNNIEQERILLLADELSSNLCLS